MNMRDILLSYVILITMFSLRMILVCEAAVNLAAGNTLKVYPPGDEFVPLSDQIFYDFRLHGISAQYCKTINPNDYIWVFLNFPEHVDEVALQVLHWTQDDKLKISHYDKLNRGGELCYPAPSPKEQHGGGSIVFVTCPRPPNSFTIKNVKIEFNIHASVEVCEVEAFDVYNYWQPATTTPTTTLLPTETALQTTTAEAPTRPNSVMYDLIKNVVMAPGVTFSAVHGDNAMDCAYKCSIKNQVDACWAFVWVAGDLQCKLVESQDLMLTLGDEDIYRLVQ